MSVPINASMAANKMFCASQPRVLKARVTPTAWSPELVVLTMVESIAEVFVPLKVTFPVPVVVMSLAVMTALAPLNTMLVAIWALTARDVPEP